MAINKRLIAGAPTGGGGACTTNTLQILGDSSCIAYYKMADATDESGSFNGTATSVNFNVEGQYGLAGEFNGSSSKIDIASTITGNNSFSVSFWLNPTGNNITPFMMGSAVSGDAFLTFVTGNTLNFGRGGDSLGNTTSNTIPNNTWTHIAVSSNAGSVTVYVNGVSNLTFSTTYDISSGGTFIGYASGYGQYFVGRLDQIRLFNKAINSTEVGTLYNEVQCASAVTPSTAFNSVLYTGNGYPTSGTQSIAVGFQSDLVITKGRSYSDFWSYMDSVRGAGRQLLIGSSGVGTETSENLTTISSFTGTGYNLGSDTSAIVNKNGETYVSYNFHAPTSESISASGSRMASTVKKNVDAGFSIASYTGNGNGNQEVGHGLTGGVDLVIIKNRSQGDDFAVFSTSLDDNKFLELARNYAQSTNAGLTHSFNSTTIGLTSSSPHDMVNASGENYIMWSFKNVDGYSRIGSYIGDRTNDVFVVTGFEPSLVLIKAVDATDDWFVLDNKRNEKSLNANLSSSESNFSGIRFTTNGFKLIGSANSGGTNNDGTKFIFMAFAQDPDTTPATEADSFEAKTYSGNSGTQEINLSNGMKPDMVWIKERTDTGWHMIQDSIRGVTKRIATNSSNAEATDTNRIQSFDADGFTLGSDADINESGEDYISWNWKAADHDRSLATINQDGSTTSLVSANQASGFSIVKYVGNSAAHQTVGHGLGTGNTPKLIIFKKLSGTSDWVVYSSGLTDASYRLRFNSSGGEDQTNNPFASTAPTDRVFTVKDDAGNVNDNGQNIIAYCFADITGYQKVGTYSGTSGSVTVSDVGFQPRWIMIKRRDGAGDWELVDSVRGDGGFNTAKFLEAGNAGVEFTQGNYGVTFTSTGFTIPSGAANSLNVNGEVFIYLAIA